MIVVRVTKVNVLFYVIAIIGYVFLFNGLYLIYLSQASISQTYNVSPFFTFPAQIPKPVNNMLVTKGFNMFIAGCVIVFADIFWYEIYFHKKYRQS